MNTVTAKTFNIFKNAGFYFLISNSSLATLKPFPMSNASDILRCNTVFICLCARTRKMYVIIAKKKIIIFLKTMTTKRSSDARKNTFMVFYNLKNCVRF